MSKLKERAFQSIGRCTAHHWSLSSCILYFCILYFRALEGAHHRLLYLVLGKITEKTGCLPPCSYIEYRILESEEILNEVDINFFFSCSKILARAQRINLAWCYGTPPPTCWWRRSSCSTPLNRWWQSLEEPLDFSLASPLWHFGTELKCSSESCQSNNHFKIQIIFE